MTIHCHRCRKTAPVDAIDFREAKELSCPRGCGAHWCKQCNMAFERGGVHSCDGQAEMDLLLGQKDWKKCPGVYSLFFSKQVPLPYTYVACQVPVEKSSCRFLTLTNALLNCSTAQGCNHMTCRCHWYELLLYRPHPLF